MELQKIHKDTDFSNAEIPEGQILTYIGTDENGKVVTRYKDNQGNTGTIAGGGGDIDTSDATVTADKLLKGVVAYGADGRVIGNIETVTPTQTDNVFTVSSGFIAEPKTLTVPESGELSVSENIVTVPAGYSKVGRKATIPEASAPTISGNVVTVNKGYQSAQREVTVGTAKAAATITPGTTDHTISAGTYLTGVQTIKGDTNLKAENIAKGVTLFGVEGSLKGGTDTSDATATSNDILEGKIAYGSSGKITGNIPTITPTTSGNVVTINKGYNKAQKEITVGTAKAAATITPTTSDITIAKGTYLSGAQTIKGDANLLAGNIKEGVSIFGVNGTLSSAPTETVSYIVSGGGSTRYNGVYVDRKVEVAGKPSYVNENGKYLCYTEDYGWIIGDYLNSDDPMYYHNGSSDITSGYSIEMGDEPSPVVSKYDPYANLIAENIKAEVIINNVTGTFTSDADAAAGDIAQGKTAYVKGKKITGTLTSTGGGMDFYKCASVSSSSESFIRVSGAGSEDCNGDYYPTGEIKNDQPVYSYNNKEIDIIFYIYYWVNEEEGETWVLDTSKDVYWNGEAYYYARGGELNSVWMAGEEGYGSGTANVVLMEGSSEKTWKGYKAVLTDGVYQFSDVLSDLSYGEGFTPSVNGIYDKKALVQVKSLYQGVDQTLVFHAPLQSESTAAATGQTMSVSGSVEYRNVENRECAFFDGDSKLVITDVSSLPFGSAQHTICGWFRYSEFAQFRGLLGYGYEYAIRSVSNYGGCDVVYYSNTGGAFSYNLEADRWYHIATTWDGTTIRLYIDGVMTSTNSESPSFYRSEGNPLWIGGVPRTGTAHGYVSDVRIYKRALSDEEIAAIAAS